MPRIKKDPDTGMTTVSDDIANDSSELHIGNSRSYMVNGTDTVHHLVVSATGTVFLTTDSVIALARDLLDRAQDLNTLNDAEPPRSTPT